MFTSCDSCMAVATAITAERSPMCLASACCTIVVALAYRAGVRGRMDWDPLIGAGSSRSLAGSGPLVCPAAAWVIALQVLRAWCVAAWRARWWWCRSRRAVAAMAICRELRCWVVLWWVLMDE